MGTHSLDPSGWTVGLQRVGSALKWSWTRDAIRDARGRDASIYVFMQSTALYQNDKTKTQNVHKLVAFLNMSMDDIPA